MRNLSEIREEINRLLHEENEVRAAIALEKDKGLESRLSELGFTKRKYANFYSVTKYNLCFELNLDSKQYVIYDVNHRRDDSPPLYKNSAHHKSVLDMINETPTFRLVKTMMWVDDDYHLEDGDEIIQTIKLVD